jgi:hypothetical protein
MARDVESLVLRMSADIRSMEKQLQKAQGSFDRTANNIERRQRQLDRNLANLGREAGNFARPVQIAAGLALGALTALSYQAAKRAEAVNGAFEQTFRDMPQQAAQATAQIAEEFGRLETDVKDNFTQMRSVLVALGVDANQSLALVDQLQRRSLDIAAFRDVSDAEAFRAVISGLTGETEPLKRFGIVLNETAVKAELLRLGFKGNAQQASEAAKVIARSNIILRQSAEMHGQVARESDTLAEQEKRTRAEFTKAAEDFGRTFLPVAAKVLQWASDALKAFNDLPSGVQTAGLALLAFVAASGPVGAAISGLRSLIAAAVAARAALAAVAVSSGAAGAGGAAAAAGAGARLVPGVGTAAAVLSLSGDSRAPDLDATIRQREREVARQRNATLRAQLQADLEGLYRERARRMAELEGAAFSAAASDPAAVADREARAALDNLGDFGLSDAQRSGTGVPTRGGGSRGGAGDAERIAAARAALTLELAIAQARATGDEALIRAAEEREELARLTQQYEAAGYADAQDRATQHLALINQATALTEEREAAEERIDLILEGRERQMQREADYAQLVTEQTLDRLGYEAQLARLGGNEGMIRDAERRLFIEERSLEILRLRLALTKEQAAAMAGAEWDELDRTEAGADMARSIVDVLRSDNIWEEAGRRFKDAAWDGIEQLLSQLFAQMGGGGKGGGGFDWINAAAAIFSGGRKAATGRSGVTAGYPVLVGEKRPEVFVPSVSGSIIPSVNAAMAGAQQKQGGLQRVLVELALKTDMLDARIDGRATPIAKAASAQMGQTVLATSRRAAPALDQRRRRLGTT